MELDASSTDPEKAGSDVDRETKKVKLGARDAVYAILKKDGLKGFWRGIGPALILVINPVIQVSVKPPLRITEEGDGVLMLVHYF